MLLQRLNSHRDSLSLPALAILLYNFARNQVSYCTLLWFNYYKHISHAVTVSDVPGA